MKKIIITGVAGFIGSNVAKKFLNEGYHVVGIDDLSTGKIENIPKSVEFLNIDLSKKENIKQIPSSAFQILHLAGQSSGEISFDDPIADLNKNAVSTLNLIDYGIKNKCEKILFASSMSVYGKVEDRPISEEENCLPLSCYGVGKLAAETYLRIYQKQLPFVSLRMFNVYGPGQDMDNLRQGMVSVFLAQALKNKNIIVKGSTDRFRDFVYIDDVVDVWFKASTSQNSIGQIINLGTGNRTTIGELLELICSLVEGSNYKIEGNTPGDQTGIYADNSKLINLFNKNNFTDLELGLKKFFDWAKLDTKI